MNRNEERIFIEQPLRKTCCIFSIQLIHLVVISTAAHVDWDIDTCILGMRLNFGLGSGLSCPISSAAADWIPKPTPCTHDQRKKQGALSVITMQSYPASRATCYNSTTEGISSRVQCIPQLRPSGAFRDDHSAHLVALACVESGKTGAHKGI